MVWFAEFRLQRHQDKRSKLWKELDDISKRMIWARSSMYMFSVMNHMLAAHKQVNILVEMAGKKTKIIEQIEILDKKIEILACGQIGEHRGQYSPKRYANEVVQVKSRGL